MNAIFFIGGAVLGTILLLPYINYVVKDQCAKAYAQGYLVGLGLKNKTDKMLKEVM